MEAITPHYAVALWYFVGAWPTDANPAHRTRARGNCIAEVLATQLVLLLDRVATFVPSVHAVSLLLRQSVALPDLGALLPQPLLLQLVGIRCDL